MHVVKRRDYNKKINLGLLMGDLYGFYEKNIYAGAKQFAAEHDINLICFIGSELFSNIKNNARRNDIYDLVSSYNIDGIIGISCTLGNHISKQRLIDFYNRFIPLPIVSIGTDIKNMPSVLCDNEKSMRQLMIHFIKEHGRKKIAFIKGHDTNPDSQLRFKVYREVLAEYNIPFDENLVLPGVFTSESGEKAAAMLFEQPGARCDAVISCNDYMALGAIAELQRRKVSIPEEISIAGFDDIVKSRFIKPTLTTVRQPTFDMGYKAAQQLYRRLRGVEHVENIVLPAQMVIRESCGCSAKEEPRSPHEIIMKKGWLAFQNKATIKEKLVQRVLESAYHSFPISVNKSIKPEWIDKILEALFVAIKEKNNSRFLTIVQNIIDESIIHNVDTDLWNHIFSLVFNCLKKDIRVKALYPAVMNIVDFFKLRQREMTVANDYEQSRQLSVTAKSLVSVFDLRGLRRVLIAELPRFAVKSLYISLFDSQGETPKKYSKLLFVYENYKANPAKTESRYFSKKLIPGGFKINGSNVYVVMPFHFEDEHVGFIIFETENRNIGIFDILTAHISKTIKVIDLYRKTKMNSKSPAHNEKLKYKKSGLAAGQAEKYFNRLIELMEQKKNYTDPDLSPDCLAKELNISRHNLSFIINKCAGLNFYDFINTYRVKEMIECFSRAEDKNMKMIDIAMDCGFRSKSTFNKTFKKYTDLTPSEFKQKINRKSVTFKAGFARICGEYSLADMYQ